MLQWIATNSPLMVLALILAILAWVVAIEEADPTVEQRYPQEIPITPSELPEGMTIVGDFNHDVQITVRAPRSVFNSIKTDDFTVTVDLTSLDSGVHRVPVQCELAKNPSRIIRVEPDHVTVKLEPQVEQVMPVRVQLKGEPTLGYVARTPVVTPSQVTMIGPSSYVSRVLEIVAQVSVQDTTADVEGQFKLSPQDAEGQSVPYVELQPKEAHVYVPIELSVYYAHLVIKVTLEGQITPGYRITDISVEPPTVTVFGVPSVINALPAYIETEPINLEGAQSDIVERPVLKVPPNVSIAMDEQPVVRVSIEPIQSSLTVEVVPQLQGLEAGFTATVSPETVEVILSGPLPLLDALETKDVRVVLDLYGLPGGTHQIEPEVVVPEGVKAQSTLPATVQVEIKASPTFTPPITPTMTITGTESPVEPTAEPTEESTVAPTPEPAIEPTIEPTVGPALRSTTEPAPVADGVSPSVVTRSCGIWRSPLSKLTAEEFPLRCTRTAYR